MADRLLSGHLAVEFDFIRRGCVVNNFDWRLPLKRLDAAGAGVVIATVNESE